MWTPRSCWQVAEQASHATPYRMQNLLGRAVWDADAVRDALRRYVVDELAGPYGMWLSAVWSTEWPYDLGSNPGRVAGGLVA
jgi:hypothetical protein